MAWASAFLDVVQCQKTFVKILAGNVLNGKIYDFSISRVPLVNCAGQGISYTSVIYFIQERLCKVSLHFGCKDMISTYEGTSLYNKPRRQVSLCDWTSHVCFKIKVGPATSPTNSTQFEFSGQVPVTCSSKGLVWTVRGTSFWEQSLRVKRLFRGLIAGSIPLVCADLKIRMISSCFFMFLNFQRNSLQWGKLRKKVWKSLHVLCMFWFGLILLITYIKTN